MPNRLLFLAASRLRPQSDSSMACAMVTDAGTPYRCSAAIAPGATALMNACWELVSSRAADANVVASAWGVPDAWDTADASGSAGVRSASRCACSADCKPVGRLAGTPDGLVSAAAGPGVIDIPVTTPLVDTVTRAVAFSHGFARPTAE